MKNQERTEQAQSRISEEKQRLSLKWFSGWQTVEALWIPELHFILPNTHLLVGHAWAAITEIFPVLSLLPTYLSTMVCILSSSFQLFPICISSSSFINQLMPFFLTSSVLPGLLLASNSLHSKLKVLTFISCAKSDDLWLNGNNLKFWHSPNIIISTYC